MERLRKTFSFRKKKKKRETTESTKPHQWLEDERKVREGNCSFQVKYLGHIEVFESRGMQVCEEAIKALRKTKKKPQRSILYVSGDALRVADEISKGLIVDQTIEKVSFCAPDRYHEKGFAYICRDGATRRWMCHAFLAVKESGERLSHAVGCAFAICLEKKQKREKESVQVKFNEDGTSFTRMGSFRQATLTERLQDPQSAIIAEPPPMSVPKEGSDSPNNHPSIPRPHASASVLERQGSLRLFPKLQESTSPFKRDLSLRLNELPSNLQRFNHIFSNGDSIPEEMSPTKEEAEEHTIGQLASDFTRQLDALTNAASAIPPTGPYSSPKKTPTAGDPFSSSTGSPSASLSRSGAAGAPLDPFSAAPVNPANFPHHVKQQQPPPTSTNPFPMVPSAGATHHFPGGASSTPFATSPPVSRSPFHTPQHQLHHQPATSVHPFMPTHAAPTTVPMSYGAGGPYGTQPVTGVSTNPWTQSSWSAQGNSSLHQAWVTPQPAVSHGWSGSITNSANMSSSTGGQSGMSMNYGVGATASDPFDVAWTEKQVGSKPASATNPFVGGASKAFELKM